MKMSPLNKYLNFALLINMTLKLITTTREEFYTPQFLKWWFWTPHCLSRQNMSRASLAVCQKTPFLCVFFWSRIYNVIFDDSPPPGPKLDDEREKHFTIFYFLNIRNGTAQPHHHSSDHFLGSEQACQEDRYNIQPILPSNKIFQYTTFASTLSPHYSYLW